jgi:hypothetical protein
MLERVVGVAAGWSYLFHHPASIAQGFDLS